MNIENFSSACRICLTNVEAIKIHLFTKRGNDDGFRTYADMLFLFTKIKVSKNIWLLRVIYYLHLNKIFSLG